MVAFKIKRRYKSWVHTHNALPRLDVLYLVLEIFLFLLHVLLLIWVWHLTPLMLVSLFIFILNPDNWHIDTTQSLCQCCRVEVKSKYFELNSFIIVSLSGVWRQVPLLLSVSPWIYQIQGVPKIHVFIDTDQILFRDTLYVVTKVIFLCQKLYQLTSFLWMNSL